jgi:hypothetical protein
MYVGIWQKLAIINPTLKITREITGPDTKSLTAFDTILKLGFTEEFKKNEIRADNVIDIAPIIPKYPPLSRMNLIIRFPVRSNIVVAN